jgi:hypothetical protein
MRSVTAVFTSGAPASLFWPVDEDCNVTGALSQGTPSGELVASLNPAIAAADTQSSDGIFTDVIVLISATNGSCFYCPLSYPLRKGETVYFSADLTGMLTLFLSPQLI